MSQDKKNKKALGRGLATLIGETQNSSPSSVPSPAPEPVSQISNKENTMTTMAIDRLVAGTYQPRRVFDEEAIAALAASFQQAGILQPLIVRPLPDDNNKYEIIAGERRWRAAQRAQLHEVPVLVRHLSNAQALEIGVIENVQRQDLNPIEEAQGYRRLAQEFHYTQNDIAEIVGKSRSYITNILRVLDAPELIRNYVIDGTLSAAHARTLVASADAETLAKQVVAGGLSVRATEQLVARHKKTDTTKTKTSTIKSVDILAQEKKLTDQIGLRVTIDTKANSENGSVTIEYKTLEQFENIVRLLSRI